jgi:hypothetical protein
MSKAEAKQFSMIEGEVVRGSIATWVGVSVFGFVLILCGIGILFTGWTEISVWGFVLFEHPFILTVGLVIAGLFMVSMGVYKLREGGRLILGPDRLQFVTARGRVLTQVPYRNISAARLVDVEMDMGIVVKRIHIDLKDTNDPETLIEHGSIYKEHHGCDCMLDPQEFVLKAERLHEWIQTHLQQFSGANSLG